MSEGIIVKLPLAILTELVGSAETHADIIQQLENLGHEWAVVERSHPAEVPHDSRTPATCMRSQWFETRDKLVEHLERTHVDQAIETVAVLRSGSPRNIKVNVKVQFR